MNATTFENKILSQVASEKQLICELFSSNFCEPDLTNYSKVVHHFNYGHVLHLHIL